MTAWRHVEVQVSASVLLWTERPVDEIRRRAEDSTLDGLVDEFCTCDDGRKRVGGEENTDHMTRMFWPCEVPVGSSTVQVIDGAAALRKEYGDE